MILSSSQEKAGFFLRSQEKIYKNFCSGTYFPMLSQFIRNAGQIPQVVFTVRFSVLLPSPGGAIFRVFDHPTYNKIEKL
ncbi:Uncharacterized protein dnm_099170 [Desulfonema magnum]|uniref:Uncharacterized protein n=1 Tax=Desulfonema magnum TaxID=45655 RepID=A0A975GU52_9BACT|nr:Uncharacterized protein dnm_099170 [Desulfonema magnum]